MSMIDGYMAAQDAYRLSSLSFFSHGQNLTIHCRDEQIMLSYCQKDAEDLVTALNAAIKPVVEAECRRLADKAIASLKEPTQPPR